jgi:aminoglycoside 6'-N-acetyltransferase
MVSTLRGESVLLRRVTDGDVGELTRILAAPEVARWWEGYDEDRVRDELVADGDGGSFAIIPVADGEQGRPVGFIQYYEQDDPDYRHAGLDLFVDPAHQGLGLGRSAIITLARHLIDVRGHHRIIIDPPVGNERAIGVYRSVGFRDVGVMRRYERRADGSWGDNLLLDLLADELPDR